MSSKTLVASSQSPTTSTENPNPSHAPETAIIEHDPASSSNTYTFPYGLKHDLAIIWWCERSLAVPSPSAGRRLLITRVPAEGEGEEDLKPQRRVVEVRCKLGWPWRPIWDAAVRGRLGGRARRWVLEGELRDRKEGKTAFILVPVDGIPKDFVFPKERSL